MEISIPGVRTLNELNAAEASADDGIEDELGRTAFLELMIAQIQNQDPLEPASNEDFIAQLAQFSSVEGIQNLNESVDSLVGTFRSSLTVEAAGLVGRNIVAPSSQTSLDAQGALAGSVDLSVPAGDVQIDIVASDGTLVQRLQLGAQPAGEVRFFWDGINDQGQAVPQDRYSVRAFANVDGAEEELTVNLPDRVVSVSINDGRLVANLAGGGSIAAEQIREVQ